MSTTKKQGPISGGQKGAGDVLGQDPGSILDGLVPVELGAVVARAAAPRNFQHILKGVWEEEDKQEVTQPINEENWVIQPIEEEEELEEEEDENEEVEEDNDKEEDEGDEDEEDEDKDEEEMDKEDEGEGGEDEDYEYEEYEEKEEEYNYEEEDENYMDRKEEEAGKYK